MNLREKAMDIEEEKWAEEKEILERQINLEEEKRALKKKRLPKVSTSKLLIGFLFGNCTIIEIFTMWVTIRSFSLASEIAVSPDFTPLVTLIGAVISEVIGYAVYALKSAKENTMGGIVYEQAMAQQQMNDNGEACG